MSAIIYPMTNIKKILASFLLTFSVLAGFVYLSSQTKNVFAQNSNITLSGYAWSENIGWISFATSTNGGNPIIVDSSENVNGYAWSDNIGWIKFGGLSGIPNGGANAKFSTSTKQMTGWARACAGTVNADCNSASRTDGWDGWTNLSGPGYGVKLNKVGETSVDPSFAWGSDVVGWIDFRQAYGNGVKFDDSGNTPTTPSISNLTPSPSCSAPNTPQVYLSWNANGSFSYEIKRGASVIASNINPAGSTYTDSTGLATSTDYTYVVKATGASGSDTKSVQVRTLECPPNVSTGSNSTSTLAVAKVSVLPIDCSATNLDWYEASSTKPSQKLLVPKNGNICIKWSSQSCTGVTDSPTHSLWSNFNSNKNKASSTPIGIQGVGATSTVFKLNCPANPSDERQVQMLIINASDF